MDDLTIPPPPIRSLPYNCTAVSGLVWDDLELSMDIIKAMYGQEFDKAVLKARAIIAENNLPSGMVMYDEAGKLRLIDTDTWLVGKLADKYTKVATVYSKRIEDANGKLL